ncbi:7SK snRNA methylphosphate capping enzyme-like [Mya arenaria]|uniref:7SK snRNA methylphosphate capping enzyme-like n=1 Tax=Mya arenaria TaxID=6604 RepID=UPI0022E4EDB0|nr:7SK snRNA methylphosphate capping enzyme-like [Mya arenaria]
MSVQVKTPTKTVFGVEKSFSSPECMRRSKDDLSIRNERKFSQPWSRKRRFSQSYKRDEGLARKKRIKSSSCTGPLPSKFLNGGNIDDPLNLNGLEHTELGRELNAVTPQSSPLPAPRRHSVSVRIPVNYTDPLHLNESDESYDSMSRKRSRSRHKKKDDESIFSPPKYELKDKKLMEALKIEIDSENINDDSLESETAKPKEFQRPKQVVDKIVSPVIPQFSPKSKKRRRTNSGSKVDCSGTARSQISTSSSTSLSHCKQDKRTPPKPKFNKPRPPVYKSEGNKSTDGKKHPKFIYGNYNRYYGYRNPAMEEDKRLKILKQEWFENKSVLDIGCNVGQLTLSLALNYQPKKITGIDIDANLINAARKNIRYYMSSNLEEAAKFPISNILSYGPIVAPPVSQETSSKALVFPQNVLFKQGNFVLENDEMLDLQKEEYDAILALSVTKWVHFNWGDEGLKRFFKRVYKQLRPGGRFILEPQPWSSYKKKKKLTPAIHENFKNIHLRPEQFTDYLLSREIGFSTCNTVDVPYNASKGFRRPILVFGKPDTIQSSPWSEIGNATPIPSKYQIHNPIPESEVTEDSSSSSNSSCSQCSSEYSESSSQASSLANCDKIMANIEKSSLKVSFSFDALKEDEGVKVDTEGIKDKGNVEKQDGDISAMDLEVASVEEVKANQVDSENFDGKNVVEKGI